MTLQCTAKYIDTMYSKHPLIEMKSKREGMWRSHYVVMDLALNPDFSDSGLVVICETSKTYSESSRRAGFVLIVIVAFILGLSGSATTTQKNWDDFVQKTAIVKIEKGCGRMQNRLVTFEDGTKACCRYRQNTDQIQGEIFSYYLGRLLRLPNMVPSAVVTVNSSDPMWRPIKTQLVMSRWAEDHPVVLTKYIQDLLPADIPAALRHLTEVANASSTSGVLSKRSAILETLLKDRNSRSVLQIEEWAKSEKDAVELAQWSDLIIFDYLTGNLDRLVNNLYNLQWNPDMLSNPAHNLARIASSGLLVFLDNESGMLHGYRLLEKYEPYHSLLLNSLCVFRKSTIDALSTLNLYRNPGILLSAGLPSPDLLPPLPDNNGNILRLRIARVLHQVLSCNHRHRVKL